MDEIRKLRASVQQYYPGSRSRSDTWPRHFHIYLGSTIRLACFGPGISLASEWLAIDGIPSEPTSNNLQPVLTTVETSQHLSPCEQQNDASTLVSSRRGESFVQASDQPSGMSHLVNLHLTLNAKFSRLFRLKTLTFSQKLLKPSIHLDPAGPRLYLQHLLLQLHQRHINFRMWR